MLQGVDTSVVQGPLPAPAMRRAGMLFVYARCQVGNNDPGRDPQYEASVRACVAAGIAPGPYFFPFVLKHLDPAAQADQFLRSALVGGRPVGSAPGELPPAFDLEWPPPEQWAQRGETADTICDWALAGLSRIVASWQQAPVVYSYPWFLSQLAKAARFRELLQYRLWLAGAPNYLTRTAPPDYVHENPPTVPGWGTVWTFNQWNGTGGARLPNGADVDCDTFNGDDAALRALCASNQAQDVPDLDPAVVAEQASAVAVDDALHAYRQARADAMLAAA